MENEKQTPSLPEESTFGSPKSPNEIMSDIHLRQPQQEPSANIAFFDTQNRTDNVENLQNQPAKSGFLRANRRIILWLTGVVLFFIAIAGVAYGSELYDRYKKAVLPEDLLPSDSNMVLEISTDPSSEQYVLLEKNLKKFPGYNLLMKEIDPTGEGRDFSTIFQENLKKNGLDFQNDIKPLLSGEAFVVIPDASPIGETLKGSTLTHFDQFKNHLALMKTGQRPIDQEIAMGTPADDTQAQVLGVQTSDLDIETPSEPLGFIIAIPIKDQAKILEVFKKIKSDSAYEFVEKNYQGYPYYEANKKNGGDGELEHFLDNKKIYYSVVGKNLISTSQEQELKEIVDRRVSEHFIRGLFLKKAKQETLSQNNDFHSIKKNISSSDSAKPLFSIFYNLQYDKFFSDKDCQDNDDCEDITEYAKYPENIIGGFSLRFTEDGMYLQVASNEISMDNVTNKPVSERLVSRIPQKENGFWTDVFVENTNVRDIYYNYKKNNLSEKGLSTWKEMVSQINEAVAIDIEKDIIDQIEGSTAVSLFTNKDSLPQAALIMEVKDGQTMKENVQKSIDFVKTTYLKALQEQADIYQKGGYSRNPGMARLITDLKTRIKDLNESSLKETSTPKGTIYSYKIPSSDFSFDFSIENNVFILATNYATVASLLQEMDGGQEKKLTENAFFQKASQSFFPEDYSDYFINTDGVMNAVNGIASYYSRKIDESMQHSESPNNKPAVTDNSTGKPSINEDLFALGSILRTVKIIGGSGTISDNLVKSSVFLNIVELPIEEKQRAEKILEQLD